MRAASRGGNHWQHVLFVLACDTAHCTERETSNAHLNAADRKSCRGTERHSHSFPLNNIIAYLSQIIVNVHNDFTLGYKLCIVHFSAKRLSFSGSNTVCMLHIESCNTDRAFSFRLLCLLNTELQTHLCRIVHYWSRLMSVSWLNKPFLTAAWIERDASGVCDTREFSSAALLHSVSFAYLFIFWLDNHAVF